MTTTERTGTAKRQRTCVGCGAAASKGALHRIVRTADGSCVFDAMGRAAGRGAYVCSIACFRKAASSGKLARALRARLDEEDCERIACDLARAADEPAKR